MFRISFCSISHLADSDLQNMYLLLGGYYYYFQYIIRCKLIQVFSLSFPQCLLFPLLCLLYIFHKIITFSYEGIFTFQILSIQFKYNLPVCLLFPLVTLMYIYIYGLFISSSLICSEFLF